MRKSPNIMSFRLDPAHFAALVEQAGAKASAGAYARELVIRAIHQQQLVEALDGRLRIVAEQQAGLRKDVRLLLQAIVRSVGKVPPEQVIEIVERILR